MDFSTEIGFNWEDIADKLRVSYVRLRPKQIKLYPILKFKEFSVVNGSLSNTEERLLLKFPLFFEILNPRRTSKVFFSPRFTVVFSAGKELRFKKVISSLEKERGRALAAYLTSESNITRESAKIAINQSPFVFC